MARITLKQAALIAPFALLAATAATTARAADVGVSIGFAEPGVYGRVDIGRFPQPVLVAPQPVLIAPPPAVRPAPVYMWVPPGHRKHWARYCAQYRACDAPVYFVRNDWYDHNVRRPHHEHGWRGEPGPGPRPGWDRDEGRRPR